MKKTNLILLLLFFIFLPVLKVDAFSLNYNQPTGKISEINIQFDKESSSPQAIEGVIVFDSEAFEFLDISTENSIIEDWVVTPYLADQGRIVFSGIFNPNFEGNTLFNIFLNRISYSDLNLDIQSGVVLMEGDVLYDLEDMVSNNPSLFNVTSSTHPDSNIWYSNKNVKLNWTLPKDAQKVKILVDQKEESYPSVEYDNLITEKQVELTDGVWYFHIRYFGDDGWSAIENKKIMVDTTEPTNLEVITEEDMLEFSAADQLSQIDKYEIIVSGLDQTFITADNVFLFSEIRGGKYSVVVRAYDKAGNFSEKETSIEIKQIESPHFSAVVLGSDEIFVSGYTDDPSDKVYVSVYNDDFSEGDMVQISDDGKFVYTTQKLNPGLYNLDFTTVSKNGLSEKSRKVVLITEKEVAFGSVERILINYGLIVLLLVLMYACSKKEIKKTKKVKKIKKIKK